MNSTSMELGLWTLEAFALLLLVPEDGANTHESNYMLDRLDCLIFHSKHGTVLTFNSSTILLYLSLFINKGLPFCGVDKVSG